MAGRALVVILVVEVVADARSCGCSCSDEGSERLAGETSVRSGAAASHAGAEALNLDAVTVGVELVAWITSAGSYAACGRQSGEGLAEGAVSVGRASTGSTSIVAVDALAGSSAEVESDWALARELAG